MPDAQTDPTINVKNIVKESVDRLDNLRDAEIKRVDENFGKINEKIDDRDVKYQIQFSDSKEAVGTAFVAQEKAIGAALTGTKEAISKAEQVTKEAITKNDANTDKRFDLISEKIDSLVETMNKNAGSQGIYVTHTDLSNEMEKLRTSFEGMLRPVITYMDSQTGKQGVVDPVVHNLVKEVRSLQEARSAGEGKSAGIGMSWGVLLGAVGFISTLIAIFAFFLAK